jgi:hypothetical protein
MLKKLIVSIFEKAGNIANYQELDYIKLVWQLLIDLDHSESSAISVVSAAVTLLKKKLPIDTYPIVKHKGNIYGRLISGANPDIARYYVLSILLRNEGFDENLKTSAFEILHTKKDGKYEILEILTYEEFSKLNSSQVSDLHVSKSTYIPEAVDLYSSKGYDSSQKNSVSILGQNPSIQLDSEVEFGTFGDIIPHQPEVMEPVKSKLVVQSEPQLPLSDNKLHLLPVKPQSQQFFEAGVMTILKEILEQNASLTQQNSDLHTKLGRIKTEVTDMNKTLTRTLAAMQEDRKNDHRVIMQTLDKIYKDIGDSKSDVANAIANLTAKIQEIDDNIPIITTRKTI